MSAVSCDSDHHVIGDTTIAILSSIMILFSVFGADTPMSRTFVFLAGVAGALLHLSLRARFDEVHPILKEPFEILSSARSALAEGAIDVATLFGDAPPEEGLIGAEGGAAISGVLLELL